MLQTEGRLKAQVSQKVNSAVFPEKAEKAE